MKKIFFISTFFSVFSIHTLQAAPPADYCIRFKTKITSGAAQAKMQGGLSLDTIGKYCQKSKDTFRYKEHTQGVKTWQYLLASQGNASILCTNDLKGNGIPGTVVCRKSIFSGKSLDRDNPFLVADHQTNWGQFKALPDRKIVGVAAKCYDMRLTGPYQNSTNPNEVCIHPENKMTLYHSPGGGATEVTELIIPSPPDIFKPPASGR